MELMVGFGRACEGWWVGVECEHTHQHKMIVKSDFIPTYDLVSTGRYMHARTRDKIFIKASSRSLYASHLALT